MEDSNIPMADNEISDYLADNLAKFAFSMHLKSLEELKDKLEYAKRLWPLMLKGKKKNAARKHIKEIQAIIFNIDPKALDSLHIGYHELEYQLAEACHIWKSKPKGDKRDAANRAAAAIIDIIKTSDIHESESIAYHASQRSISIARHQASMAAIEAIYAYEAAYNAAFDANDSSYFCFG